jgi:hypothetical protein
MQARHFVCQRMALLRLALYGHCLQQTLFNAGNALLEWRVGGACLQAGGGEQGGNGAYQSRPRKCRFHGSRGKGSGSSADDGVLAQVWLLSKREDERSAVVPVCLGMAPVRRTLRREYISFSLRKTRQAARHSSCTMAMLLHPRFYIR